MGWTIGNQSLVVEGSKDLIADGIALAVPYMPAGSTKVAHLRNDTAKELRLYLEMTAAEVVLAPGHEVELLARPTDGLLPVTIDYVDGGLQIHPHKEFDPEWHVRFRQKLIRAGFPTVLADYE